MWCEYGGVDGQCLIFVFQVQIGLQVVVIYGFICWMVFVVFVKFQVLLLFFGVIQIVMFYVIIKFGEYWCGGGDIGSSLMEGGFGKEVFEVSGVGFYIVFVYGFVRGGDLVGCVFLVVGFLDFIVVEYQFWVGGDCV